MEQRKLTTRQKQAHKNLEALWNQRKKTTPGITQEKAAAEMGMTQGNVGHYLKGRMGLGIGAVLKFARYLNVSPLDIDPEIETDPDVDGLLQALGTSRPTVPHDLYEEIASLSPESREKIKFAIKAARLEEEYKLKDKSQDRR